MTTQFGQDVMSVPHLYCRRCDSHHKIGYTGDWCPDCGLKLIPADAKPDAEEYDARPDDYAGDDIDDEYEPDEEDPGDECGRWDNGRLGKHCSMAGTEFCDFECPYRDGGI